MLTGGWKASPLVFGRASRQWYCPVAATGFNLPSALKTLEIIRNSPLQIVLRGVTKLGARTRNIVYAGSGIGHAEEIQPRSDLDVGARKMLADDARDVVERDADAGADIVDAAVGFFRRAGGIAASYGSMGLLRTTDEMGISSTGLVGTL